MAEDGALRCSDSEWCLWSEPSTDGDRHDRAAKLRHAMSGECPIFPAHVEPGTAMAGAKLMQALNRLAEARKLDRYAASVVGKASASTSAYGWLAVHLLAGHSGPVPGRQVDEAMPSRHGAGPTGSPLLLGLFLCARDAPGWWGGAEGVFRAVRRGGLVDCTWATRPWRWWVTDDGHDVLRQGAAVIG